MALPRLSWDTHLPMGTGASCSSTQPPVLASAFLQKDLAFYHPLSPIWNRFAHSCWTVVTLDLVQVSLCMEVLMDAGPSPAGLPLWVRITPGSQLDLLLPNSE